ncbi:MAG: type II toxin-antitoxin system RelE/ParE family toxin [Proteobacteria bacterium]|nr:type II toxin-antitoxin system RelE/ParE family toxin [Pseudomonadota bacterium]
MQIRFRPEAETELLDAVDWYEARARGLGAEFLRALDAVLSAIDRYPESYPIVFDNLRRAVLRRFPYSVIYTLADKEILIVACTHGARDPKRWQSRG